jgi:glycosyltransferase involved in cell wall biosynthesis
VLAFAARNGLVFAPPAATAADAARDAGGAAAFLLTAWRGDPALRARFPRALRDGADGPFGRWLAGEGAGRLGLEPDARAHLLQALDNRPGYAVRHLFHWRWDLRFYFPLALTRWGRAGLVRWLKTFGANLGIDDTATWWFLLEAEADAGAALEVTYRLMPEWQRLHPEALGAGRAAWGRWLNATYGIPADAPGETGPAEPARRDGVNLVAHLCMPCGVQAVATACCRALRAAGRPVALRDAPLRAAGDPPDRRDYLDTERHPVSVTMLHPFFPVTEWYGTAALHPAPDAYRVGYWYWEFPEVPAAWIRHARDYDEAWAPSRFIENAFRAAFDIPVHYLPAGHAIDFEPLPRRAFDLPDDRYLFLFVYDPGSGADRKNAEALIDAYRLAVRPDDRAQLVLKTTRGHDYPGRMHALARRADGLDVRFLDCTLSRSRTLALINAADCYVSLHRSEGSGLSIAEAMMMGKPAIATGYSGNMDFMTPDNSLLVGYRPVALEHDQPPYRAGWTWAEPDIEHAAAHMRTVLDERERAAALAERGRQDTLAHFDMTAYARRLDARLQAIGAMGLLPADTRCRAHSI